MQVCIIFIYYCYEQLYGKLRLKVVYYINNTFTSRLSYFNDKKQNKEYVINHFQFIKDIFTLKH